MQPPAVAKGAVAAQGPVGVAQRRHDGGAGDGLAAILQADERAPQRHAAHEVAGAVDGIDDPAKAGIAGLFAVLLAEEGVLREGVDDAVAQERLGGAVAGGDGAAVELPLDVGGEVGGVAVGEEAGGDLRGALGRLYRQLVARSPVGIHERRVIRV